MNYSRSSIGWGLAALVMSTLGGQPVHALEGMLLTSDYNNQRVRVTDLAKGTVVYDLDLGSPAIMPRCALDVYGCSLLGMQYSQHEDADFVDVMAFRFNPRAKGFSTILPSMVSRVELSSPPRNVFTMEHLDFRSIPNWEAYCVQGVDEAYGDLSRRGCTMQLAHGLEIIDDHPVEKKVSYVSADAFNMRVLKISMDYNDPSNRTGTVDWIIGADNPDWPAAGLPNNVRYIDDPEGPLVLITFYQNGESSGSAGSIMLFHETADGWRAAWQFPDPAQGDVPFLHAPHMAQLLTDPVDGKRYVFYAHGRGMADAWGSDPNQDVGGTLGVLLPGANLLDRPTYLGEGVPFLDTAVESPSFRYARDVDFLADGRLILSDAACENSCPSEPAKHFVVEPFHRGLVNSPLQGYFSPPDYHAMALVDLPAESVDEILLCGHDGIFESHYLPPNSEGRHLRRAARSATLTCAEESVEPAPERTAAPTAKNRPVSESIFPIGGPSIR